jgi:hypothetical protein
MASRPGSRAEFASASHRCDVGPSSPPVASYLVVADPQAPAIPTRKGVRGHRGACPLCPRRRTIAAMRGCTADRGGLSPDDLCVVTTFLPVRTAVADQIIVLGLAAPAPNDMSDRDRLRPRVEVLAVWPTAVLEAAARCDLRRVAGQRVRPTQRLQRRTRFGGHLGPGPVVSSQHLRRELSAFGGRRAGVRGREQQEHEEQRGPTRHLGPRQVDAG